MMNCGLLGRKLGHSYSPQIHRQLGAYSYALYEKEPEELEEFLKNGNWTGLNVTIPYKKAVIPYLDRLSSTARQLGAVNTIVQGADGSLTGHNTDYFGFGMMLKCAGVEVRGKKVLVLGSGGASNTAVAVLKQWGAEVVVISRSGENHYGNLERHADAAMIVNATPVGMYPKVGASPVDLGSFPALEGVLDLIYNPAKTALLLQAEERGLKAINGLLMLVAQAKESAEWFTGAAIGQERIGKIHAALSREMKNIVLIGMPGCGKSTVGRILAERTGKIFADADERIEALAGKPIPRIFAEDGEEVFRDWETRALEELGKESGLVIATGGGCVTKERNALALCQNGHIFWLQREISLLATAGRPLSQTRDLGEMARERWPMYERFAEFAVGNDGSPEETAEAILGIWGELL